MVGHVVDEHFARLAILGALDQVTDAGLAGVARGQRSRVRQHGLDHFQRHHFQAFGGLDRLLGKQAKVLQHGEHIDVVLAEAHPEAHVRYVEVLRNRVNFVVAGQVQVLRAYHWQVVGTLDLEHGVAGPLAVLPAPHLPGELAEVDFRVEVGGEVLAMRTGIDVENVDRINAVEILLLRQLGVAVHHTRVETDAENGGNVLFLALFEVFPLVVAVPGRRLADLARFFVNGGVQVGDTGIDAGTQHRHVEEGRAHVDHDLRFGLADQCLGRLDIEGVEREGLDVGGYLEATLGLDAVDDGLAFGDVP
ncbi:hypothetical protein D3C79_603080 [compost metagenome]